MKFWEPYCLSLYFCLLFLLPAESDCQTVINEGTAIGLTPQEFVETYLVGTGITVSNALYNGSAEPLNSVNRIPNKSRDQIGSFVNSGGAETQLGINGGVILSAGYSGKAAAGNNPSDDMWGNSQPAESDPDLVILANNTINDKSVLEFDFVPQTDVVTFRYVFGSIEFDGFCGSINDAFGLFLSGPGISGGFGFVNDAINIALLPNSTSYVTIFNICAADQGNQGNGVYSWWNSKKDFFSYNRLTYVFSASYTVVCNQTYHMKFAIGDASDGILDSGVFLEQNSFSSNNVASSTAFSNPLTGQLLVEGYTNVSLVYTIAQPKTTDTDIDLLIHASGTANQADITPNPFPVKAIIPAGQLQSTPILINALSDGLPEGVENLVIKGTPPIICGISNTVTNEFSITDYNPLAISMPNATICNGNPATLTPVITGGQLILPANVYNYLWSTGATTSSITVSPPAGHHLYSVTVSDACSQTVSKEISVDVGTTPGAAGAITGVSTVCTPASGLTYSIPSIPGVDGYLWTLPPGAVITAGGNTNTISVDFSTSVASGVISVMGHSTVCGDGTPSSLSIVINPGVPQAGSITGQTTVCQGPSIMTYSIAPLSFTTSYEWTVPAGVTILSGSTSNQITCLFTNTAVSGDFTVRGYNAECNFGLPSILHVTVNPIPADAGTITSMNGSSVCIPDQAVAYQVNPIPNVLNYNWSYTGSGVTLVNNGPLLEIGFTATATSGILSVKGVNGCGSGAQSPGFSVTLKPRPAVQFDVCNTVVTSKNGRPILLKGGKPMGAGGEYFGTGVSMVSPGIYIFDPANNNVIGGNAATGADQIITYRYTNIQGCSGDQTMVFSVYGSNAADPCPGTLKDQRDGTVYPIFQSGTGATARCWMAADLNYGAVLNDHTPQTDNCTVEKYCPGNLAAQCLSFGGFYQWSEIMEYQVNGSYQDICPAGWHVPTSAEWQGLIDANLGNGIAGGILKDMNLTLGFRGMPDGLFYMNNFWAFTAGNNLNGTMYWTSTISGNKPAARGLNSINPSVSTYKSSSLNAFPVRCIRN